MNSPIRAVYRAREDGDYDFMAAFANDEEIWDGDVAETCAEALRAESPDEFIVKEFADLTHLVDVLNGASVMSPIVTSELNS